MKITIEFGRRNAHSLREQNKRLRAQNELLTDTLLAEKVEHDITKAQLQKALEARVEQRHRSIANSQALRVIQGGQARFQLNA